MSRRSVSVLAAALAAALPLMAQDDSCSAGAPLSARTSAHIDALFAPAAVPVTVPASSGAAPVVEEHAGLEVMVAVRDAEGHLVFACVDSAAAAKRFLETRPDRINTGIATAK